MPSPSPSDSTPSAAALLARFLAAGGSHSQSEFDALCREHPDRADEIQELYEEQGHLQGLIDAIGVGGLGLDSLAELGPQLRPGVRVGSFTIEQPLGRGAMGEVWLARDASGKAVAIKLMHAPLARNPRAVLRFRREAEAGRQLNHPNVVRVEAAGLVEGCPYMVQELVEGGRSLADWLKSVPRERHLYRRHFARVARITRQVAEGLQHAHELGIVHRDVKPQNVLLATDDSPRVVDFGLALVHDEFAVSQTGDVTGTAAYMSPEQIRGGGLKADARSDVFGLGVVLYELLTLRRPFEGASAFESMRSILEMEPVPPRKIRREVPMDLERVCMRALSKNADARFQSMAEFAAALGSVEPAMGGYVERPGVRQLLVLAAQFPLHTVRSLRAWVRRTVPSRGIRLASGLTIMLALSAPVGLRWIGHKEAATATDTAERPPAIESASSAPESASTPSASLPPATTVAEPSAREVRLARIREWAEVITVDPDPSVVTDPRFQEDIRRLELPWRVRDRVTGIEMLLVPPGSYRRGASPEDDEAEPKERPAHWVTISAPFYLGRYEVQKREWTGTSQRSATRPGELELPIAMVSPRMIQDFLQLVPGLRLPTEGEWEYACRAGTTGRRYDERDAISVTPGNSSKVEIVGGKSANALGFHDMLGNVWELCSDWFQPEFYSQCLPAVTDPTGPTSGTFYVLRGGSFNPNYQDSQCRASIRGFARPDERYSTRGFRVAHSL